MKGQHESCNENFYWTNADNSLLQIKQKHDKTKQGAKLEQVLRIAKIQQTSCKITSKLQLYHERQNKTNVFCCL